MDGFVYADASTWEDWQREYRYGAFFIFPPEEVIGPVDALRRRYDPRSDSYCRAHISLSQPLKGPLTEDHLRELRVAISTIEPFEMRYGPLRDFPPHPGVAYAIGPEDAFYRLRAAIHATSAFQGASWRRVQVAPHMTIAEFISLERTAELLRELSGKVPEGTFRCTAIKCAVPNEAFFFERVLAIPLGSAL